ncbi:hypothetical protein GM3708_3170 [Geminocystis sp. NIES-3708]|uniref:hypothetical protein n=1 Tax=Geminocystis sp. NIES-3708 TaxID=1615909 RepID=UPI0005FC73CD|nr:hypothetical protein [Geminocystis sp. NIES-3708]BAQ62764.1 hypothetical protein GM3708_3170 [Geminocystis sp. NIES-3708]
MEYVYFLGNASLILRVINYFETMTFLKSASLTVIHQINGWVIRIKIPLVLSFQEDCNIKAFLTELGTPYNPGVRLEIVFWSLDMGDSPVRVMRNYRVAIVSHGKPDLDRIEIFRQEFTRGLGYQPETFA